MDTTTTTGTVGAARVFSARPDRLATLWRKERNVLCDDGTPSLLEGLVESFIREIGATLAGAPGHPWSRTHGVLRLSAARGSRGLHLEFASLRRCLIDALEALGGTPHQRRVLNATLDDALDSSLALLRGLAGEEEQTPRVPFGGLVVELFERPPRKRAEAERSAQVDDEQDALH